LADADEILQAEAHLTEQTSFIIIPRTVKIGCRTPVLEEKVRIILSLNICQGCSGLVKLAGDLLH